MPPRRRGTDLDRCRLQDVRSAGGSPVDRETTLACYSPASRIRLDALRSQAIAERGGFTLDAEIMTVAGNRRWIRLTATVECDSGIPVRIFGMKQDITEEKILADRTRYLAEFDTLTGLPNRTVFYTRLTAMGRMGALLLLDLDGFKQVNDTHGHMAGDACLTEVGRRLMETCRHTEFVARIGGDEFGIVVGRHHRSSRPRRLGGAYHRCHGAAHRLGAGDLHDRSVDRHRHDGTPQIGRHLRRGRHGAVCGQGGRTGDVPASPSGRTLVTASR